MKNVQIDMMNREIRMTKRFYKQSMEYGSYECNMLSRIVKEFPQFKLMIQASMPNNNRAMFPSFAQMEQWIALNASDYDNEMQEFRRTVELAHCYKNVYNFVRKWFFQKYGEEYKNSMVQFSLEDKYYAA